MTQQEREKIMQKFSESEVGVLIEDFTDKIRGISDAVLMHSERFDRIDYRFDVIESDIRNVYGELAGINTLLHNHDSRIEALETETF